MFSIFLIKNSHNLIGIGAKLAGKLTIFQQKMSLKNPRKTMGL